MRRPHWAFLALARRDPPHASMTRPRSTTAPRMIFHMTASGYCPVCDTEHVLHTTPEAISAARDLIRSLESTGRVDFDVVGEDDHRDGRGLVGDARLSVRRLVEDRGKMFGVLVAVDPRSNATTTTIGGMGGGRDVDDDDDDDDDDDAPPPAAAVVILKAFSGKLNGHWTVPGWSPALYATEEYGGAPEDIPSFAKIQSKVSIAMEHEAYLVGLSGGDGAPSKSVMDDARMRRKDLSRTGMSMLRDAQYVTNYQGVTRTLSSVFLGGGSKVPVGTGDCCATKLVAHASYLGLRPTGIAEFYYGRRARGNATRVMEGVWYDACEPRCRQVLGFMLCGLERGDENENENDDDDDDGGLPSSVLPPRPFFAWSAPTAEVGL
jgi:hypothetical protein